MIKVKVTDTLTGMTWQGDADEAQGVVTSWNTFDGEDMDPLTAEALEALGGIWRLWEHAAAQREKARWFAGPISGQYILVEVMDTLGALDLTVDVPLTDDLLLRLAAQAAADPFGEPMDRFEEVAKYVGDELYKSAFNRVGWEWAGAETADVVQAAMVRKAALRLLADAAERNAASESDDEKEC